MLRPNCQRKGCHRFGPDLGHLLSRRKVPRFEGKEFCSEACLEQQLEAELSDRWHSSHRKRLPGVPRPKIGSILVQSGTITPGQLENALALQRQEGYGRIGEWLQRDGTLTERQITLALSRQYGLPVINLRGVDPPLGAIQLIPGRVARCFHSLPVGLDDEHETLLLAVSPPVGFQTQEALRRMTGKALSVFIGDESRIRSLQDLWYGPDPAAPQPELVFEDLGDVLSIVRTSVAFACENRALNLQIELVEDCLWTRIDFPGASLHRFCRHSPPAGGQVAPVSARIPSVLEAGA